MPTISEKSTGMLLDELVTNAFKTAFAAGGGVSTEEFDRRYLQLSAVLEQRLEAPIAAAIHDLCVVSLATWQAQEIVMTTHEDKVVAEAAKQAQVCNAKRTKLIRKIDSLLGEAQISITTKTYG